jgi:glycopeptide antibiotics resistance protein
MKNRTAANRRKQIETAVVYGVFTFYLVFLFKLLFLSRVSSHNTADTGNSVNLIPLRSITDYLITNSEKVRRFAFSNVIGNILIFVPLGGYLSLFRNKKKAISNLLAIAIVSLLTEIIQGFTHIGTADIDDLILNTLGGFIGILGYKLLVFLLADNKKVHTTIAILSLVALPILFYLLFMIRLRL